MLDSLLDSFEDIVSNRELHLRIWHLQGSMDAFRWRKAWLRPRKKQQRRSVHCCNQERHWNGQPCTMLQDIYHSSGGKGPATKFKLGNYTLMRSSSHAGLRNRSQYFVPHRPYVCTSHGCVTDRLRPTPLQPHYLCLADHANLLFLHCRNQMLQLRIWNCSLKRSKNLGKTMRSSWVW